MGAALTGRACVRLFAYQDQTTVGQIRRRRTVAAWMIWGVAISTAGISSPSFADNWRIQPAVSVRETWTDNVTLVPSSQARSDFVTEISPSLTIQGRGSRARMDVDYRPTALIYARDSGRNDVLNHAECFGCIRGNRTISCLLKRVRRLLNRLSRRLDLSLRQT